MSAGMSANLLTEARKRSGSLYWALTIELPGGDTLRSDHAVTSITEGLFEERVTDWGTYKRDASDPKNAFDLGAGPAITEDDTDRAFAKALAAATGHQVRNSVVTVQLASTVLLSADWFTTFAGRLVAWDPLEGMKVKLKFMPNDLPLLARGPQRIVRRADWPSAAATGVIGEVVPLIYGIHSSKGTTDGGMAPTLYVDQVGFRYLVCLGYAKSVDRVYVDAVLVTTGYAITHPVVNGVTYTVIDFTTTQGDSVVTCDVTGYEPVGDGSGAVIENEADQNEHWLHNFVYRNATGTGAWATTGAPVQASLFASASAFCTARGYVGSRRLASLEEGHITFGNSAASFGCMSFWTNSGNLGLAFDDHAFTDLYGASVPFFRSDLHPLKGESFLPRRDYGGVVDSLLASYCFDSVAGDYSQKLLVKDTSVDEGAQDTYEMPASAAYVI